MSLKSLVMQGVAEATEAGHTRRASSVGKIELGLGPDDSEVVMGDRPGAQERDPGSGVKRRGRRWEGKSERLRAQGRGVTKGEEKVPRDREGTGRNVFEEERRSVIPDSFKLELLAVTHGTPGCPRPGMLRLPRGPGPRPGGAARDRPGKEEDCEQRGGGGREGILRKKKQAGVGRPTLTGSRPSGRIRFKQYLSVGLSCLR